MPQLNSTQLGFLDAYVPSSLENFKTAYFAAKAIGDPTPGELYYSYLADNGFEYGNRALGVVRNDTIAGQIANKLYLTSAHVLVILLPLIWIVITRLICIRSMKAVFLRQRLWFFNPLRNYSNNMS